MFRNERDTLSYGGCGSHFSVTATQQVNGRKLYQRENGVQLTVIDGHDGKVVESKEFRNHILQGIPAQILNYVNELRDG